MALPTSFKERRSFWHPHIIACQRSGLSKARYCREHQLDYQQLIYWYSKFSSQKQQAVDKSDTPGFLPVAIEQPRQVSSLHIRLPNGIVIDGVTERTVPLIGALIAQL